MDGTAEVSKAMIEIARGDIEAATNTLTTLMDNWKRYDDTDDARLAEVILAENAEFRASQPYAPAVADAIDNGRLARLARAVLAQRAENNLLRVERNLRTSADGGETGKSAAVTNDRNTYFVIINREHEKSVIPFKELGMALEFADKAGAQWSETYVVQTLKGPLV